MTLISESKKKLSEDEKLYFSGVGDNITIDQWQDRTEEFLKVMAQLVKEYVN